MTLKSYKHLQLLAVSFNCLAKGPDCFCDFYESCCIISQMLEKKHFHVLQPKSYNLLSILNSKIDLDQIDKSFLITSGRNGITLAQFQKVK